MKVAHLRTALAVLGLVRLGLGPEPQAAAQAASAATMLARQDTAVSIRVRTASPLTRPVSLDLREVPLGDALKEIDRQAGLRMAYTPRVVDLTRHVTIKAERIPAGRALARVLEGTGVVVVEKAGGVIVLVKQASQAPGVAWSAGSIRGRVTDAKTGAAIATAEVLLERTRWRAATDTAGYYRLSDVDSGSYTLTVRRIGYQRQSRSVTVRSGQEDTVSVALEPQATRLDSLVTTVTGQQQRRSITNAITTIAVDSVMQNAVVRNVSDLLATRVTGLTAQHTSGAPGDPTKLRLRGIHSVYRSNDPIVFVDGIRVYAAQSEARSGSLTNLAPGNSGGVTSSAVERVTPTDVPAPSPLDQIDPNIIEKIEVVKGPSAATLYGADAANGVILITTKRGKAGPTRWDASFTHGRTTTPGTYPTAFFQWGHDSLTGTRQFCVLAITTCVVDSIVQFQSLNDPTLTPLGRGHRNAVSLTAAGGTRALTYRVTGTYGAETGSLTLPAFEVERFRTLYNREAPDWMRRPHQLDNWSVSSAIVAALGSSADVTLSTTLSRTEQSRTSLERQLAPMAGTYVDTLNGLYYRPSTGFSSGTIGPPLLYQLNSTTAVLDSYYVKHTASFVQFTTGLNLNWRPMPWLVARGDAGLNVQPRNDQALLQAGLRGALDSGHIVVATGRTLQSTFNLGATATKPVGLGFRFQTTVGVNLATASTTDIATTAAGLVPGTSSLSGARRIDATQFGSNTSSFGWYVAPELVGERFSISAGLRLDGGSAYGTRVSGGSGLLKLPKLGGAWVISEEPWFPLGGLFQSLKLRGSYGQSQVQPGPTDRLRLYAGSAGQAGELIVTTVGNVDLRPERATEFEGGFEGELFDSRLSLDLTWHRTKQVDALMPTQLAGSVHGGGQVFQNIGDVLNTGLELDATITPVRQSLLTWSVGVRYTKQSNTLIRLGPGVAENRTQGLVEGFPVNSRWARPILGYGDQNGDGRLQFSEIQLGDTLVYLGRLLPDYTSGFTTNLSLFGGAVGLAADVSYIAGATQIDQTARTNWVLARGLVDPTSSFADQAAVLATNPAFRNQSDYGLTQDVSTFRLNNLSLSYRAPASVARLVRAQQLRVAVQGSNLALHSTYSGGRDPDVSAWQPGNGIIDTGQLPQPRTWQVQVNVTY